MNTHRHTSSTHRIYCSCHLLMFLSLALLSLVVLPHLPLSSSASLSPPPSPPYASDDDGVDTTSTLSCPELSTSPMLFYNQTISCSISCHHEGFTTTGTVDDYVWKVEEVDSGDDNTDSSSPSEVSVVRDEPAATPVSSDSPTSPFADFNSSLAEAGIAGIKQLVSEQFGLIANKARSDGGDIISFTYTAPASGQEGVMRVMVKNVEIVGSPIMFSLSTPNTLPSSTGIEKTPTGSNIVPTVSDSSSFFSLQNTTFIIILVLIIVVGIAAIVALFYAARAFYRRSAAITQQAAHESHWIHSVGKVAARLDHNNLHAPFTRLN